MTGYAHPESLVDGGWLACHLTDPAVRIVDVRFSDAGPLVDDYAAGHIPGAVFCDLLQDTAEPEGPVPCRVAPPERFEAAMRRMGISNDTHVVAYDQAFGPWAARLWWALRYYGHDRVSLLDGGLRQWRREGRAVEEGAATARAAVFHAAPRARLRASLGDVMAARSSSATLIVDALPGKIYRGEVPMFPGRRAGHIPEARNVSAPSNIDRETGLLLGASELRRVWGPILGDGGRRVITYCGAGAYGAFDLFALHLIGHEAGALYDGSWMEWAAQQELPVATGPGPAT